MKLFFTQDALVNAGAERSHLEILSRFSKEVDVGFVYFYPKHELREAYTRAGIRLFFLDIPEGYHFLLAVRRLVGLIKQEKPDVLISSLWRADMITRIASLLTGVPLVGTLVNDSYSPIAWMDKKGLKYKVVYWLDRLTAGIPVHWIANAQALADSHVKTLGIKKDKISVVYRGRPVIAGNVIAPARRGGSEQGAKPALPAGRQSLTDEETASSAHDSAEQSSYGESSLAVTGDVIAGNVIARTRYEDEAIFQAENSFDQKTASAANDPVEQSGLGESSLVVTGDVIAGNVIARTRYEDEAIFQAENSFDQKTASAANGLTEQSGNGESSLAVTKNFISYGRLLERKGFQDAIRAFSQVVQIYPDCTLTIFGEGPYRTHLEKLIQELGLNTSVFLPGKIPNPIEILLSGYSLPPDHFSPITANYFLFPSWYEGFSGALVEAMMAGMPIIASDIPMNLEAVNDGKTALTFKVGDSQELFEKMKFAIEHPQQMAEMGKEARREAEARFDIEKIAIEYEAVVNSILNHRVQRD